MFVYTANHGETAACLISTRDYKEVGSRGAAVTGFNKPIVFSRRYIATSSFLARSIGAPSGSTFQSERRQENLRDREGRKAERSVCRNDPHLLSRLSPVSPLPLRVDPARKAGATTEICALSVVLLCRRVALEVAEEENNERRSRRHVCVVALNDRQSGIVLVIVVGKNRHCGYWSHAFVRT